MSNIIKFPTPRRRPNAADLPIDHAAEVVLLPTDAAYDSAVTNFRKAATELGDVADGNITQAIGSLATYAALLGTHPSCSEQFIVASVCSALRDSSDLVQQSIGDYPEIVKILGQVVNNRNRHPAAIGLRATAFGILSQNPGEFNLKTGERLP